MSKIARSAPTGPSAAERGGDTVATDRVARKQAQEIFRLSHKTMR